MNDVVDKIRKIALEEKEKAEKLRADIILIADDINHDKLGISFERLQGKAKEHTACAVDGGKYEFDLGDSYLIMAKAVRVTGKYGEMKEIPNTVVRDFKVINDYYGEDEVKKRSIYLMLSLETSLLSSSDCDVIFIDGPLIDPPVYDESLEDYFLIRSSVVMKKKPIGIVKRFSHRLLVNHLLDQGYPLSNVRESYLVTRLIRELRKNVKNSDSVILGWIDWSKVFKEGDTTLDLSGLKKAYERFGLQIYSAYFQLNVISPVVRIDSVIPSGLEYVLAWGIEGQKELTLLNKIADNLAKFKEEEVRSYISLFQTIRGTDFDAFLSKF